MVSSVGVLIWWIYQTLFNTLHTKRSTDNVGHVNVIAVSILCVEDFRPTMESKHTTQKQLRCNILLNLLNNFEMIPEMPKGQQFGTILPL